jgi:hypothetical protein
MKGFLMFIVVAIIIISAVSYYNSTEYVDIKVTKLERITTGAGSSISSKFIVYTDREVFENTDEMLLGKFNSIDFQNKLKVDSSYSVEVIGWRMPMLSMTRNIIKIRKR